MESKNKMFSTQELIKISLLGSIAVILMQFGAIKLPAIFPSFLEIDFSEVPAIVAILTINPIAGLIVVVIKNILKAAIFGSSTGYVGELANMLISIGYILPLMLISKKGRDIKKVTSGIVLGILGMMFAGAVVNYFITIPLYAKVFMPMETIVEMGNVINPAIVDKFTLVMYAITPFNLLKGVLVAIVSVVFVKAINPVIKYLRPRHN
ncbi:MAG: ECF transporter S component [Cellulosilyticaceae bacterium]